MEQKYSKDKTVNWLKPFGTLRIKSQDLKCWFLLQKNLGGHYFKCALLLINSRLYLQLFGLPQRWTRPKEIVEQFARIQTV